MNTTLNILQKHKLKIISDNLNKNKFSSIMNNIVDIVNTIDIEKYTIIEKERETIMNDEKFIQWCNDMNIGSRVEVKDYRAIELQQQYEHNYPKWVQRMF